ncbi:nucleotidyltransferase domain-containing protein [Microbacterium sp.]|uniref:nucleotidyltransferase family protein n=1 Tax=Microbacterium sp. TaxID=51671 RepID=UPI0033413902
MTHSAVGYPIAWEHTDGVHPSEPIAAGGAVLRQIVEARGFADLAAFGSAARGEDHPDSDLDLLVQSPEGADVFDMLRWREVLAAVLGRVLDLVSYRGLDPRLDQDVLRDEVPP